MWGNSFIKYFAKKKASSFVCMYGTALFLPGNGFGGGKHKGFCGELKANLMSESFQIVASDA